MPVDAPADGELDATRALGVYVHVPFCSVHCPYCDFAIDVRAPIPHAAYGDAVRRELRARHDWFAGDSERLVSLYFGGGTPSLWAASEIAGTVRAVAATFGRSADELEITLEANPGEMPPAALVAWRAAGVNRLSVGVQSFHDPLLRALGRNHDSALARRALREAREAGFDNVSLDLMYGLPGQTVALWQESLDEAVAALPAHVSAYALTVEPGTPFGRRSKRGELVVPDEELVAEMGTLGQATFARAGLRRYEVSSFARPGREAVHNGLYWSGGAFLGLGVGAASFRPLTDGTGWRFTNVRATETYLRAMAAGDLSPLAECERRTLGDLENEAVWLSLRTADGLSRSAHERRHGLDPLLGREEQVARCVAAGWLLVAGDRWQLTDLGWLFADEVAARLWRG